jgi:hypothetical protein
MLGKKPSGGIEITVLRYNGLIDTGRISFADIVGGSPMLPSAKIVTTGHCGERIMFASGLAESREWHRHSLLGRRACTIRLTSAFNPL